MHVALILLAVAACLALLVWALLVVRRQRMTGVGGTFACSLRLSGAAGGARGWTLGLARYSGDSLDWFRLFSLTFRPRAVLRRRDLVVLGRRVPSPAESASLLAGSVVLECLHAGVPVDLAMAEDAVTGFLAWLESAPPGQHLYVA